jgi:hypothetical protein
MVQFNGRLYISPPLPLIQEIMQVVHEEGHEGVQRTIHRLHHDFHFSNMKWLVQELVRVCVVCQRYKSEHLRPPGILLPLLVLQGIWTNIRLDFIEALPHVRGKSVILKLMDHFSKYGHFIPLAHPYSTESVA